MEQENQKANTVNEQNTNTQNSAAMAGAPADGGEQTFDQLMAESPKLSPFCGWLKCLRKPALSMEYSIQKRHVPDLDADCGLGGQQGQHSAPKAKKGQNSDTMGLSGSFTIRYFDFALGVLGLAIAGCLMKGCCCLKRKML